ncbi:MAG: DegV family protein [Lachnospiraceae bacterium]|nr:DegV family protein [Lachnospiraceae bacterium]
MSNVNDWVISTDTTCDLPDSFIKENDIDLQPLHYLIDGVEYGKDLKEISIEEFYKKVREGVMPVTSATNMDYCYKLFLNRAKEGKKVLHVAFASALSASCSNAFVAAEKVKEEYPDAVIKCIDTKTASAGLGCMVRMLVEMRKNGASFEDAVNFVENNKARFRVHFTVYDLFHLVKGGRLKKTAAILGTILKIQPELRVNDEGGLEATGKVRGRKAAINKLVDEIGECENASNVTDICICHADCETDANTLAQKIKERYSFIKNVFVSPLSQTLGSHTGPDALVIGYLAGSR